MLQAPHRARRSIDADEDCGEPPRGALTPPLIAEAAPQHGRASTGDVASAV